MLFDSKGTWIKKDDNLFDVTMGSFDGAEICELVGLYQTNAELSASLIFYFVSLICIVNLGARRAVPTER